MKFGATAATTFTVNSATSITATSPAEAAGTVDVTVTTGGGTSATRAPADQFTYTVPPRPTVTGVSPTTGPTTGGTSVTITGTNFTGATAVTFGATAATTFTVNSATSITATSPAEAAGTVDVTVTTPGAPHGATPAADQFTYVGVPRGHLRPWAAFTSKQAVALATLAVSPQTVGDVLVVFAHSPVTTLTVSSVSGGGVTTWTKGLFVGSVGAEEEIWFGKVTTTGSSTVTFTWSASISGHTMDYGAQEFTAGLGSTTIWAGQDRAPSAAPRRRRCPSPLSSPTGTGELYFGYSTVRQQLGAAGIHRGLHLRDHRESNVVAYDTNVSASVSPAGPRPRRAPRRRLRCSCAPAEMRRSSALEPWEDHPRAMEARLVKVSSLSASDERSWRQLADRAVEPNPYFEPDFLSLSVRHFPGYAHTTLVLAQEGDEIKGLLPLVNVERRGLPPRTVARSHDYPTGVSSLCTPLVDRACVDQVVGVLLDGLRTAAKDEGWPGIFSFDRIGDDGPVAESIRRVAGDVGLPVHVKDTWVRGAVNRTGRWDSPVDGNRRREIGRRRRHLAKDSGAEVSVVERSLDPDAVDEFLKMEASGYKGKEGGLAFSRTPETVAWFGEWRQRWAAAGRLVLLSLNVGDVSIAMQCFVRSGPGLFCFRIAFDEAYARYYPGAMLLFSSLEYLRDRTDAQWIDSCSDKNNGFFLGMLPERRKLSMLLIGTGGVLDRSLVSSLPTVERIVALEKQAHAKLHHRNAGEVHEPQP